MEKDLDIQTLLTKSAKRGLDEALYEYKERILDEAYAIAKNNNTEDEEISLNDILEARKNLSGAINVFRNRRNEAERKRRRMMRALFILFFVSFMYVLVGIVWFLIQKSGFQSSMFPPELATITVIVGMIGIIVSILTGLSILLRSQLMYRDKVEEKTRSLQDDKIMELWSMIERDGYKLVKKNNVDINPNDISSIIEYINQTINNENEDLLIKDVLKARNIIAQGQSDSLSPEEKEMIISKAYAIRRRLIHCLNS